MRTTTTVWNLQDGPDGDRALRQQQMCDLAESFAGPDYRNVLDIIPSTDETTHTAIRAWPDLASAELWVAKVLEMGAASAVVDPE